VPILSAFYGLIIYMFHNEGGHNLPHIHVEFKNKVAVIDLKGNILKGKLDGNKKKLIDAWMILHQEELELNWELCKKGESIIRIDPLK